MEEQVDYYGNRVVTEPVDERLAHASNALKYRTEELKSKIESYQNGKCSYNGVRIQLISAIGFKAAVHYIRKEMEATDKEELARQHLEHDRYEVRLHENMEREKKNREKYGYVEQEYFFDPEENRCDKVVAVRKGTDRGDGKPYTQREFARFLGYPISLYAAVERGAEKADDELMELLVIKCNANPYWLFDDEAESWLANYPDESNKYEPDVIANDSVVLKWFKEGKPHVTEWSDCIEDGLI